MPKNPEAPDGFGQYFLGARAVEGMVQEVLMDAIMGVFCEMLPALRGTALRIACFDQVRNGIT